MLSPTGAKWSESLGVSSGSEKGTARSSCGCSDAGPSLLRFGRPTIQATSTLVCCSYPIEGGMLAQRPAGEIAFEQIGGSPLVVVRSRRVRGFFPSLAARQGERDWTGALYE